jgi:hypothetical protein
MHVGGEFSQKVHYNALFGVGKNGNVEISRSLNADTRENIGEMRSITMKEGLTLPPPAG